MHLSYLPILCDPYTREPLNIQIDVSDGDEVLSGRLLSKSNVFTIRNGIPRFIDDEGYNDNFGFQWNRWSKVQFEKENVGRPMEGVTKAKFLKFSNFTPDKIANSTVLDIGCGSGRFSDIVKDFGGKVIGLDYSSAIDAARENLGTSDRILLIQGDALRLPLADSAVDYVFSVGVLHHTPSPKEAVNEAYRVLKAGGEFALRVYSYNGFYTTPQIRFWRFIFKKLKPVFKNYPALVYAYLASAIGFICKDYSFFSRVLQRVVPCNIWLPDFRWTVLDTFDAVSTIYQSGHKVEEIESWLAQANFSLISHLGGNDFLSTK